MVPTTPTPMPLAGGHAELELVEQTKTHLGVGERHLRVRARHVLEQLDVDVVASNGVGQHLAVLADDALGLILVEPALLHHLLHAHVEWLQLEQNEKALKHRHLDLLPAHVGLADVAAPLGDGGGAAVEDEEILEGVGIDLQVEAIVGMLGQDERERLKTGRGFSPPPARCSTARPICSWRWRPLCS
jgi:hypothetical protein